MSFPYRSFRTGLPSSPWLRASIPFATRPPLHRHIDEPLWLTALGWAVAAGCFGLAWMLL